MWDSSRFKRILRSAPGSPIVNGEPSTLSSEELINADHPSLLSWEVIELDHCSMFNTPEARGTAAAHVARNSETSKGGDG